MKIILVLLTHIDNLPPARNLLLALTKNNVVVDLITMYSDSLPQEVKDSKNITIYDVQSKIENNPLKCLINRFIRRKKVRKLIKKLAKQDDVIWTVTDYDAMEVGKLQLKHKHVTQLMELIKDIPVFDELPFFKANIKKYAKTADVVIVPEYNRAHIQKAYWDLEKLPVVLPHKPTINFDKKHAISPELDKAREVLEQIGDRKIILYQGVFGYERVLDQFIEAVELLGSAYCILLMGRDDEVAQGLRKKYPHVFFIPFISAPNHLYVTARAHIGILSYVNSKGIRHFDPLNAIYCAPNKLYEYSCFGVPMVGNNIPGLDIPFRIHNIGLVSELTAEHIAEAIQTIEKDYELMSKNCEQFYESVNIETIVDSIINELKAKD